MMATWRNGYAEDCKSYSLFTHTLIIPYKLTYLLLIQTASAMLGHWWATLSLETVERCCSYLQSQPKCPKTLRWLLRYFVPQDLVFNRGTSSDIKIDPIN